MDRKLNVLITGSSSGIGKAVCDYFLSKGDCVYGIDLKNVDEKVGLTHFSASVTDESALLEIKQELSKRGITLDVVLNIAGIHKMASLVENDYSEMKKVIDVNLCGCMLVCKTFHSLLAKTGRVVIVTSEVAGLDPMPFNGLYNVSKTALDCYAQALRQELNLLGQKVVVIRPGAVQTPLCDGSLTATQTLSDTTTLYSRQAKHFLSITKKFMGKPMSATTLAKLVYKASTKRHPKLIYNKHRNAGLVLLGILPKRTQCWIIKKLLNRK